MPNSNAIARRDRARLSVLAIAMVGVIALLSAIGWYLWRTSIGAEERRLGILAENLGQRVEDTLTDARGLLERLNADAGDGCSPDHIALMLEKATARPYVRSVGFWEGINRRCGVGFVQGRPPTPARAGKSYNNGVVAWWPGPDTRIGELELFIIRLGAHDLAIDTRLLLNTILTGEQKAGLWVEGLLLAAAPADAVIPSPNNLNTGLTIDRNQGQLVARFALDTLFPMDVVAVQSSQSFLDRYHSSWITAVGLALALMGLWAAFVWRLLKQRLSITGELRSAIEYGDIQAVYQPIVNLDSGACCGAEILARWMRSNGEMIGPDVFIPLAEQHRIIGGLTRCILQRALQEVGHLLREHPELSLNLNLSPLDLEDCSIATFIASEMANAGLHAHSLKLEITERALVDREECRELIRSLRRQGHPIAIDDFGTGYSSLAYLESFELDTLKLDKAFVDATETEAMTSSVILHIIEMGRSLELDMVAEGVEVQSQASWLRARGVQMAQGYLYSKPLTASEFEEYLKSGE